jgi:hypothetical protein
MFSFKTLITVIIEDQDIANSHKQYFIAIVYIKII